MFLDAKVMFHMYKPAQFVTYAGKFLDLKKEAKSVEKAATELREIESQRKISAAAMLAQQLADIRPNPSAAAMIALAAYKQDPSIAAMIAQLAGTKLNLSAAAISALPVEAAEEPDANSKGCTEASDGSGQEDENKNK